MFFIDFNVCLDGECQGYKRYTKTFYTETLNTTYHLFTMFQIFLKRNTSFLSSLFTYFLWGRAWYFFEGGAGSNYFKNQAT